MHPPLVAIVSFGAMFEAVSAASQIPLCPGLTIVTAINQPDGDYESIKTIQGVTDKEVSLKYSTERKENGIITTMTTLRTILREDLRNATLYQHHFANRGAVTIPGTTAIGTSAAVLHALKTKGEAELGIFDPIALGVPVDRNAHPNTYEFQMVEKIQRVSAGPVMIPLTVNGEKVQLPAIQAHGDYTGDKADFYFLDDESNPLSLRYRIGRDTLNVIKITARCTGAPVTTMADASPSEADQLDEALSKSRRAEIYSIYFSFNSDLIREESAPTLRAIGEVMRRHPDWKLAIEGHTDGIATDTYNLELSRRRAAAVKNSLVTRHSVGPERLTTEGYGKSRPKDTNDTLEGRARNRRVELQRIS
jgi:outer membrane protein OmpA-like peptidoglycan-associated protein